MIRTFDNDIVDKAIDAVMKGRMSYCKFLSANDSGETQSHQSGILISKSAKPMLNVYWSDEEMNNSRILKKEGCKIRWQDDYWTNCTFTWYSSKNELRMTGFGRGKSPMANSLYSRNSLTGALFILVQDTEEEYEGYFCNTDDTIRKFLAAFGLTPVDTNRLINTGGAGNGFDVEKREDALISEFIKTFNSKFPATEKMAEGAHSIYSQKPGEKESAIDSPDNLLLEWTAEEYKIFRAAENAEYMDVIAPGFKSVEDFVKVANKVLNRRKSRAGKSLEHHLATLFDENKVEYTAQGVTEENKKPDFIFPSVEAYHDPTFLVEDLCTLAAKTTCKDRWRQILNEADRLRDDYKYLCTLQQGISVNQLTEMESEKVILVVPQKYHSAYPKEKRNQIWTVHRFITHVKEMEEKTKLY